MNVTLTRLKTGFGRLPDLKSAVARAAHAWTFTPSGTLSLRLPRNWPASGDLVYWWWQAADGVRLDGTVRVLDELPEAVRGGQVIAWTPGAETLFTRVTLPTKSRAKIMQALPYALEEQLVGEPESMYFSYRSLPDGSLAVAVTDQERFKAWLEAVKAAGLHLAAVCPATLGPPLEDGCWALGFDGDELLVRSGEYGGFSCPPADAAPPAMLLAALREVAAKGGGPREIIVYNPPAQFPSAAWAEALGVPVSVRTLDLWAGQRQAPFNLLQRDYAPSGELRQSLRAMRPAAYMLGAWLVAVLALNLWDWWNLASTQRSQRAEMTELFKKSFPDAKAVVDPVTQMERNFAILQANSGKVTQRDMLSLLGKLATLMRGNPQAKLRGLQYGDGALTMDLNFPDFQMMESMKNSMVTRGLQVEVLSANSRGTGVDTRLRVRPERRS